MPKEFVVDMEETYPFGELGEVLNEDTKAVVRKALKFEGEEERAIIKQMVHFLKAARHESLINVERMLEGPGEV
jgi:flagellar motor component MotA